MSFSDPTPFAHDAWRSPVVSELQEILPQHEVLDFIGRGGMGAVYKALQKSLNRVVAVKLLPRHSPALDGLDFAARFKVEAQSMARLSHPNIVSVHEFGHTDDGLLYYVMEFVDGTDLGKRLASEGRLPVDEALRIALAVCDALVCAHAEGVVHRDIKPSNILLSHDGKVKVTDFGLAKMDDPSTITLTLSGTSMGSQGYAAPEVFAKAVTADHRADIYSLGVVLYEMLTGDVPRGMFKLPSEKVPALDTRFDELICKAMEEDREERFQSAAEFKDTILSVLVPPIPHLVRGASQEPVPPVARSLRTAWVNLGIGAAILALAGLVWLAIISLRPHSGASSQIQAATPTFDEWQSLLPTFDGKNVESVEWDWASVDGKFQNPPLSPALRPLSELPVHFSDSCDLRFRLTKSEGDAGYLHFGFRHGEFGGGIVLLDRETDGISFVGVSYLDGLAADKDSTWVRRNDTPLLPLGETRTIHLLIRDEGVAVLLDGTEVYRWTGDWRRLGQLPALYPTSLEKPIFAVGGSKTKFTVYSAEVRRVTGDESKRLPPAPEDPSNAGDARWADEEAPQNGKSAAQEKSKGIAGGPGVPRKSQASTPAPPALSSAPALAMAPAGKEPAPPAPQVASPGVIDLLALVDVNRDAVCGDWSLDGRELILRPTRIGPDGTPRLQLPYQPPDEYDFEMEFTPESGINSVQQVLSAQGRAFTLLLDMKIEGGIKSGFNVIDGIKLSDRKEGTVMRKEFLKNGQRHLSVIEVRRKGLRASLDGEVLATWRAGRSGFQPLDISSNEMLRDKKHLGIAAVNRTVRIHRLTVREVSGKGTVDAVVAPAVASVSTATPVSASAPAEGTPALKPPTDAELRDFATWLFSLPPSTETNHTGPNKVPDLIIDGYNRNLRHMSELPATPFSITRVRTGPLRLDNTARKHLEVLRRIPRLWDLRIYGADDAAVLGFLHGRSYLGTFILKAAPETRELKDIALTNFGKLTNLSTLRLENWRGFTGQGFAHLIEKRSLDSLGLEGCPDISDEGLNQIARFPHLKALALTLGAGVTDAGLAKLAKLGKLETLFLNFTNDSKVTGAGLEALAVLKNLRVLRLEGAFPGVAFAHAGKLASLQVLECFRNSSVTDAELPGLAGLKNLRSLHLTDTNLTGTGFAGFTAFPSTLQHLRVDDCKITAEGLRAIVDGLPELQSLVLSRNMQNYAVEDVVSELSRATALRKLQCGYGFKDEHMPELAKLTRLSSLNLQSSHVTDAGLPHLKPMTSLTELTLAGLPLTDACLPALKEIVGLKNLVLKDTKISETGVSELKKALPRCNILR